MHWNVIEMLQSRSGMCFPFSNPFIPFHSARSAKYCSEFSISEHYVFISHSLPIHLGMVAFPGTILMESNRNSSWVRIRVRTFDFVTFFECHFELFIFLKELLSLRLSWEFDDLSNRPSPLRVGQHHENEMSPCSKVWHLMTNRIIFENDYYFFSIVVYGKIRSVVCARRHGEASEKSLIEEFFLTISISSSFHRRSFRDFCLLLTHHRDWVWVLLWLVVFVCRDENFHFTLFSDSVGSSSCIECNGSESKISIAHASWRENFSSLKKIFRLFFCSNKVPIFHWIRSNWDGIWMTFDSFWSLTLVWHDTGQRLRETFALFTISNKRFTLQLWIFQVNLFFFSFFRSFSYL